MPRALRVCAHPGCPEIATVGGYCPAHAPAPTPRPPDTRLSPSKRGYDRAWQALRKRHLRLHPVCEVCGSDDRLQVDHIVPISRGGGRLDPHNLQTLCHSCHSRKTATERAR